MAHHSNTLNFEVPCRWDEFKKAINVIGRGIPDDAFVALIGDPVMRSIQTVEVTYTL